MSKTKETKETEASSGDASVAIVEFSRIETDFGNYRSELTNVPWLTASIREKGLLGTMLVWHQKLKSAPFDLNGRMVWDRYILLDGHRRHAALSAIRADDEAMHAKVRVTLFHGNRQDAEFAQFAANQGNEEVSAMDVANKLLAWRRGGLTDEYIAERTHKPVAWVTRMCDFRESACAELLHAVSAKTISTGLAIEIAQRTEEEQHSALVEHQVEVAEKGPKAAARATRAKIEAKKGGAPYEPPRSGDLRKLAKFLHENTTKPVALSTDAIETIQYLMGYRKTLPGMAQTMRLAIPRKSKDKSPSDAE
jgi:hypothetical protein